MRKRKIAAGEFDADIKSNLNASTCLQAGFIQCTLIYSAIDFKEISEKQTHDATARNKAKSREDLRDADHCMAEMRGAPFGLLAQEHERRSFLKTCARDLWCWYFYKKNAPTLFYGRKQVVDDKYHKKF